MSFTNRGLKLPPEPLTSQEVRRLLDACGKSTFVEARNWTLILLLYRTGLRLSEALELEIKGVDIARGTIRVLHGKGDRSRVVGLDQTACEALSDYLVRRLEWQAQHSGLVFCTREGTLVASAYVRRLLPRLAKRAGITKRVHAHGLRHTHAFELASEGVPVHVIQAQLGHGSLATTDRYIRHIRPNEVIEAMQVRRLSW